MMNDYIRVEFKPHIYYTAPLQDLFVYRYLIRMIYFQRFGFSMELFLPGPEQDTFFDAHDRFLNNLI